jgi:hypothetical protein
MLGATPKPATTICRTTAFNGKLIRFNFSHFLSSRLLIYEAKPSLHPSRIGEAKMEFPHWLMIGGALLVFVGLVGAALQRRRAAADPSSLEQRKVTDGQPVSPPKFLE